MSLPDRSSYVADIAHIILGEPNHSLSTRAQLRFGSNGSVAVELAGERAGEWYDHENQIGGGIRHLIEYKAGVPAGQVDDWLARHGFKQINGHSGGIPFHIVAIYDYCDERGQLLFQVCRLAPKDFRQRRPDGNGGWTWKTKGIRKVPYRLPELLAAPLDQVVFIPEGEKDCNLLVGIGLVATCNPGGAANPKPDGTASKPKWPDGFAVYFKGRNVVILPDNDEAGHAHAQAIAHNLAPVAASVRIVDLAEDWPSMPPKGDVSDWLGFGGNRDRLEKLAHAAKSVRAPARPQSERLADPSGERAPEFGDTDGERVLLEEQKRRGQNPIIQVVAGDRHLAADRGIDALVDANVPFYQRNRKIQRVALVKAKTTNGEIIMVPGIVPVDLAIMARELGRSATWQRYDMKQKKHVRIDPPAAIASQILSMVGEWPFAPLNGIVQCPTLRRDGTLLDTPGYDETTGLVLVSNLPIPKIPIHPTRAQALQALALLSTLLEEFPFIDNESKAVALSMIITPVVRGAMAVAPMHLVTKPAPGTGGSYLADCAAMVATGERCAVESMAPNYEETEKRLVGSALSGFPIIGLDNCRDIIAGDFFCQIVERPLMSLRALGKSDKHRIPNTFTMFANGNNATVADDMVRRTIRSGLDANLEHPETRTFKGNPLDLIQRNCGQYIAAALTIPLAYLAAGCPDPLPPLVSFEEWSKIVRSPLVWLGCEDPVKTQEKLRAADPRKLEKIAIFNAWKSRIGVGQERACMTKEIIDSTSTDDALREALLPVAAQRFSAERQIDPKALGKWLSAQQGTIAAGCKLSVERTDAARPRWYLEFVG